MTLLVVLSPGTAAQVKALQTDSGQALSQAVQWGWDDRWQHLGPGDDPNSALQMLQAPNGDSASGVRPALLGLPLDPGLPLACGGHWAEALGAWRQPALLVCAAEQLQTGVPAAMTALLERWQVPLVGLVQWGEPWAWAERRRDGLPWLGALQATHAAQCTSAQNPQAHPPLDQSLALRSALDLALRSRLS
jgi:hypothetical protein